MSGRDVSRWSWDEVKSWLQEQPALKAYARTHLQVRACHSVADPSTGNLLT